MTEQVDPFGPFKVKICDDIAPEGEFEVQVVDEDGNLMDIETVPLDFYRQRYWKNRLRNWLEGLVNDYADASKEFDLDENWKNMRLAWMDTFPQAEREILKGEGSEEEVEGKEPDFVRYEKEDREAEAMDLLENPNLLLEIDDAIHEEMAIENRNALLNFLVCISAFTEETHEPTNLDWSGRTSTGKTVLAVVPLELLPDEMVMDYVGMSEKSLYHDGEKVGKRKAKVDFRGKIMLVLEKENAREALDQIKPVLSHDKWVHQYKYAEEAGKTVTVKMVGWPVFIGCTVEPEESSEQRTRSMSASPETGERKYRSVIDWKGLQNWAPWESKKGEKAEKVRDAIRLLKPRKVWIPFIPEIRRHFPDFQARHQRDWDRIVTFIASSTILHQYQRDRLKVGGEEYLVSVPFDGLVALRVLEGVLQQTMMELTKNQIEFHEHCQEKARGSELRKTWTRNELREEHKSWCGERISYTQVCRSFVDPWKEQGVIEIDESGKPHRITVKSTKLSTKFPNLEKMVKEISNFDYGEEKLRERFYAASQAMGHNPGEEFDFEFDGALDLDSAKKVYNELQARLARSGGAEPFDWFLGNRTKSLEEKEKAEPLYEKPGKRAKPLFEKPSEGEETPEREIAGYREKYPWLPRTGVELRKCATLMGALEEATEETDPAPIEKVRERLPWWDRSDFDLVVYEGKKNGDIHEPEPDAYSLKEPESPDVIESIGRTQEDMANSCLEILTGLQRDYGKVPKNIFVHCCREDAIPQDFANQWLERAKREGKVSEVDEEIEWLGG